MTWLVHFDIRYLDENLALVEGELVEPIYLTEDITAGLEVSNLPTMLYHFFVIKDDSDLGVTHSLFVALIFGIDIKGVFERINDFSICLFSRGNSFLFLNCPDKDFDVFFVGAVLPDHQ